MTEKEQSKELVGRFLNIVPCNDNELSEDDMHKEQLHIAKQCALICVDEFIDSLSFNSSPTAEGLTEFYTKVKQEIIKL